MGAAAADEEAHAPRPSPASSQMPIPSRLTTQVIPEIHTRTSTICNFFRATATQPQRHVRNRTPRRSGSCSFQVQRGYHLLVEEDVRSSTGRSLHSTRGQFLPKASASIRSCRRSHSSLLPPTPPTAPESQSSSFYTPLLTRAAMAVGMVYCVTEYVSDITLCEGPSMSPTIQPSGEIVCIDKWNPRHLGLKDGCVGSVRAQHAQARQAMFVAEHPQLRDEWHQPWISVSDLKPPTWKEAWQQMRTPVSVGDVVVVHHPSRKGTVCKRVLGLPGDQVLHRHGLLYVPDGHVWLEGDNPANSSDSRNYGPVPAALIVGRVVARLWPLRGQAWMIRGGRPRQPPHPNNLGLFAAAAAAAASRSGSTVLPAGYEGQHIRKPLAPDKGTQ